MENSNSYNISNLIIVLLSVVVVIITIFFVFDFDGSYGKFFGGRDSEKSASGITDITASEDGNLVENSDFRIAYLPNDNQYIVTLKTLPIVESKAKAEMWLSEKLEGEEICSMRINFEPSQDTVEEFGPSDLYFTGCPGDPN